MGKKGKKGSHSATQIRISKDETRNYLKATISNALAFRPAPPSVFLIFFVEIASNFVLRISVFLRLPAQLDSRAVRQHLGNALSEFGSIVAHGDDGVGPQILGVVLHKREGIAAGLLANLHVCLNVAAHDARKGAANTLRYGLGAHHDAAHHPQVLGDLRPFDVVACGDDQMSFHRCLPFSVCGSTNPGCTWSLPGLRRPGARRRSSRPALGSSRFVSRMTAGRYHRLPGSSSNGRLTRECPVASPRAGCGPRECSRAAP